MADSFFGFDTSISNLNDDEGGGGPSEDEYDALNNETFGQTDDLDWELQHESLAQQLESSRRHNTSLDDADSNLEASLSKLVLDDNESPHKSASAFSSVWRNDANFPPAPTPSSHVLKNVVSVEELERQLRQKQTQHQNYPPHPFMQPRYQQPMQPVILQRPPGLQPPPHPFQQMNMNQPMNSMLQQNNQMNQQNHLMQNQMNQNQNQFMQNQNQLGFQNAPGQSNMLNQMQTGQSVHSMNQPPLLNMGQNMNHIGQSVNQLGQSMNQIGQNVNPMGQGINQIGQNVNQMSQGINQMGQNVNQIGQGMNQMGQGMNQIGQNVNQMSQGMNQMGQNVNQIGQGMNQMGQGMNQMGQNPNQMGQMGQNMNQIMPNGNQFGGNMNQFPPMMGQSRMIAPPPGMMQRPNFNTNMGQFNPNFRAPLPEQPNMMLNQMHPRPKTQTQTQTVQNQTNQAGQQQNRDKKPRASYEMIAKKMTSQNLVQKILDSHPMLQHNNSYHNASHHPLLNRNVFNNFMYNQRVNGAFNNNQTSLNGDASPTPSDQDEYAGLMTSREKQWLINIQMLQLDTGTPYLHDFYYTVFLERRANKERDSVKEAHKANQQNHPFYSGGVSKPEQHQHRERHSSVRHNSTSEEQPRTYVPAQFENSLGKLQCGSVTAPRKIIDAEVVSAETNNGRLSRAGSVASLTPTEVPRETKRTKQLLLDIEGLYLILLRLEEMNDPLAISNALILKEREEKQKQLEAAMKEAMDQEEDDSNVFLRNIESVQKRPKQDSPKSDTIDKRQVVNLAVSQKPPPKNLLDENRDNLVNKMFAGLLHGDRLQQMLMVRKGRALIARFVCGGMAGAGRQRALWARLLRGLTAAARRDTGLLPPCAVPFNRYIQNSSGWSAVLDSCSMMMEAFDPARTPYALTSPFTLSCICSLIEKASTLVSEPNSNERQWYRFLKSVARAMKNTSLTVAKPVQPLSEAKLHQHLRILESRTTIEILQRGKTMVEFADLTKQDVADYLTRYLC